MPPTVYLFKAKEADKRDDYSHEFTMRGYNAQFIPVLDHETIHIQQLRDIIAQGPQVSHIGGLVFCSQRAVQAWQEAANGIVLDSAATSAWQNLPLYIVGPQTAKRLQDLDFFAHPNSWIVADRASILADAIVAAKDTIAAGTHLFLLSGDKRRDELPDRMGRASIPMQELKVYQTCQHPQLAQNLAALSILPDDWVVFFSPSGVVYIDQCATPTVYTARIAAIGPTTADHLVSQNKPVSVVASKPCASALAEEIAAYDNNNNNNNNNNRGKS